jgi:hypothetical protein
MHVACPAHSACAAAARPAMTAVWFAPEEEVDEVEELEELDKALEEVLEVAELLVRLEKAELLVRLEKAELLLVAVLEADAPVPDRK